MPAAAAASTAPAAQQAMSSVESSIPRRTMYSEMSIQAQLEANDIPESAAEPGPGHYFGPSSHGFRSFGKQKFSHRPSAPELSIAKTGWDQWAKVRISEGHAKSTCGQYSPGPQAYDVPSSLNKQATKIGTSLRPDLSKALGVDPDGSPGPLAYNIADLPVKKPVSPRKDRSFGKGPRFATPQGAGGVGPGQYARKDPTFKMDCGRSFGIGRHYYDKVVRPGWEREGMCLNSQGPGPPLWRDIKKDGSKAFSIGTAERFPMPRSASAPGPGQYDRRERDMVNMKSVCSDTRTPKGIKFGRQPRKPRLRLGLIGLTSERGCWGYF
eukprot:gnl/TRDRNA2_/TRDRNA2_176980_c0_seq1.p1 gnl/TRDRNA2_/TRDRNA2_176980_c0~~gnl/TRDRNA2_/TRDRNA2_176980_c0_seq1.p1  ORF type:complete len:368 (+),score=38.77 gnl/TRDRNA2_/TRDRNA2_176980_c0_seq1:134-1105(+)